MPSLAWIVAVSPAPGRRPGPMALTEHAPRLPGRGGRRQPAVVDAQAALVLTEPEKIVKMGLETMRFAKLPF